MTINKVTHTVLTDEGVDVGKMAETVNAATSKREITKERFSQGKSKFARSESSEINRNELTDAEDFALTIMAFDAAMTKVQKTWGLETWNLPVKMLETAKTIWPYRKPAPKLETQNQNA